MDDNQNSLIRAVNKDLEPSSRPKTQEEVPQMVKWKKTETAPIRAVNKDLEVEDLLAEVFRDTRSTVTRGHKHFLAEVPQTQILLRAGNNGSNCLRPNTPQITV